MVRVRVNYVRDSFSVLLRAAHHYSMLMTFVFATTANNVEPNIQVHIINPVHVNKGNWESLVYNNYCRMVRNCVHDAEGLIACHMPQRQHERQCIRLVTAESAGIRVSTLLTCCAAFARSN